MSEGFAGDPFHESEKPMVHLKGGIEMPHTQAPMAGENSGDTGGNTTTPEIRGWHSTSLGERPSPTGSSDSRKAH
jgi:hypothetical protein